MYGQSNARDILLLAAEDAFEFERWRDAGPVTADIDPEVKAAEIAEFEALGIPMPAELDSLRRELEHAAKVREAIRHSSLALRRHGRASASALVALAPQQLMPMQAGALPWGVPLMDPRLAAAAMDPRFAARLPAADAHEPRRKRSSRVAAAAEIDASEPIEPLAAEPSRARARVAKPVEAEVVDDDFEDDELDDFDDDDFDDEFDERPRSKARARQRESKRRAEGRRARAARPRDDWDDEQDDDGFDSAVLARPAGADPRTTWVLGGISAAAVIALLWIAFNDKNKNAEADNAAITQQQNSQQLMQQQAAPVQQPPLEAVSGIDPATGLPLGQAPAVVAEPKPAPVSSSGRRSSGVSAVRSPTPAATSGSNAGGVNPFATYKTPDDPGAIAKPAEPTPTQPAAPGSTPPASNGGTPAAGGGTPAAGEGATEAAGTAAAGQPTPPPAPAEEAKPAEQPKPEEPQLTKSKMTPAIRQAVMGKVGDLQACYQDAVVGKPDLAGQVTFTISLDQDGVVKRVEVAKDEVKYGVAKCAAKKIQRWTLPSAGIPIIFDLPFDFKS